MSLLDVIPDLTLVFCKKGKRIVRAIPKTSKSSYLRNEFQNIITCSDITLELEDGTSIIRTFFVEDGKWKTNAKDIFLDVLDLKTEFLKPTGYDTYLMIRQREENYRQFVLKYSDDFPELIL